MSLLIHLDQEITSTSMDKHPEKEDHFQVARRVLESWPEWKKSTRQGLGLTISESGEIL